MDPETPRELGDIEDTEPERRDPARSVPVKKSLQEFLAEFERRLHDHPGEPATTAQAALEGRAQGVWRTPVESGERSGRRPARRPQTELSPDLPAPEPPEPEPLAGAGVMTTPAATAASTAVDVPVDNAVTVPEAIAPAPGASPADAPGAGLADGPADDQAGAAPSSEAATPAAGRKRHRRHRRPRRK